MEPISLNEYLSADNIWTKRLLGIESFGQVRNCEQIEREYNQDFYGKIAAQFRNCSSINEILQYASLQYANSNTYISFQDEIFRVSSIMANQLKATILKSKLEQYCSDYICELGCGYGINLTLLDGNVYGGEYCNNAVKLAQQLGMEVYPFNYYNMEDYGIIKESSTVFTCHSIEQIPDARCVIEGLSKCRDKIRCVVNFEPTVIHQRKNFLGLIRNRYIELNDYNRNLIELLQKNKDIEILEYNTDVFGINPLNPFNIIAWQFKS
ncbi:MAG: hypothetical protein PHF24_09720 [Syntrophomonas sp.]|nr:hypothetical protein [Syntrophomonas sp.]